MIERKARHLHGMDKEWRDKVEWQPIPNEAPIEDCMFRYFHYRIQGVIYTKRNKRFEKAFEQERVWEQLSG